MKNFGHLIQTLKIHKVSFESDHTRKIHQLVNLHCSKTLNEIHMEHWTMDNFLNEFKNPFGMVKNVYLMINLVNTPLLNETFPMVHRLSFSVYEISNTNTIDVEYVHLKHLEIQMLFNEFEEHFTEDLAGKLISKNPHVKSLILSYASPKLLEIAANSMPQLERLELNGCKEWNFSGESIHLKNVTVFEMKGCPASLLRNITFSILDEINSDDYSDSDIEYIFIGFAYDLEVANILKLIENNKQLKRFQLILQSNDDQNFILKTLIENICDKWFIKEFSGIILLEKY